MQIFRQNSFAAMNISVFFIATRTFVISSRGFLPSTATRTLLTCIAFVDRFDGGSMFFQLVGQLFLNLAETPIGQLLTDDFSSFLSGVSLYAFYSANDNLFDAVFYTPLHKISCCFMDGIVHLSFALTQYVSFRSVIFLPLPTAFFAFAHE